MGASVPKQFIPLNGKPLLMWTVENFHLCDPLMDIILVLPHDQQILWQQLCEKTVFHIPHRVVDGGETRFESVKKGVEQINADADTLVAVHDGVRPFVSKAVVENCFQKASVTKAAIPVLPVFETLRELPPFLEETKADVSKSRTADRERFRIVQTPQVFSLEVLRKAYAQPYREGFTDDATVVESIGVPVSLVKGNRENIKITTPFDLTVAEAILRERPL